MLRAYYAAGLGSYDKPGMQVTFPKAAQRDGDGSRVLVDLPYGKSLKDAMAGAALHRVRAWMSPSRRCSCTATRPARRRHTLWVADRDPLAVPVGRTPLLACRQTDIWKPAPMGLDERGQLVKVPLMWHSILVVGAAAGREDVQRPAARPVRGAGPVRAASACSTSRARPDWRKFALVADSFGFGLTISRHG